VMTIYSGLLATIEGYEYPFFDTEQAHAVILAYFA